MENSLKEKLKQTLSNPVDFTKLLKIKTKDGNIVKFSDVILNEQKQILKDIHSHDRIAIIKSRQLGATTTVRAYCFWQAFISQTPFNSAIFSNKARSSNELLEIDRRFYNMLPSVLKKPLQFDKYDKFGWNNGCIMPFSGAASNDRGYTLNVAHLSEFAFMDNADDVLASTIASVNKGKLILESTPNVYGDKLHQIALDSERTDAWKVIFLPWTIFPEYYIEPKEEIYLDSEELSLKEEGLSDGQILWRRFKLDEIKDKKRFLREYPRNIDEAYSYSDDNYFSADELKDIKIIPNNKQERFIIKEINRAHNYVIGVDISGGTGGDYSVATVFNVNTFEVMEIFSTNVMNESKFAFECIKLADKYNKAFIYYEENNHGSGFKATLNSNYYNKARPHNTNIKSKIALFDKIKQFLVHDKLVSELDSLTMQELKQLINKDGLAPTHPPSGHDDRVISLGLCFSALQFQPRAITSWDRMTMKPTQNQTFYPQIPKSKIV